MPHKRRNPNIRGLVMVRAGEKIGPYNLTSQLGTGAFGTVWLAEKRTAFGTHRVALKIARDGTFNFEEIKREASLWEKASNHANVLSIYDADVYDGETIVIASQYAPDGSLEDWLNKHDGVTPSVELAIEIENGILAGLVHLHALDIVHRDLKPANILMQGETPRLADFGLARVLEAAPHSMERAGTFPYMAPEAFDGVRSRQTDIWSAGVVLYQLLTGELPFPQKDVISLVGAITRFDPVPLPESVPASLRAIILRALKRDVGERYKSATEMRMALRLAWRKLPPLDEDNQAETALGTLPHDPQQTSTARAASVSGYAGLSSQVGQPAPDALVETQRGPLLSADSLPGASLIPTMRLPPSMSFPGLNAQTTEPEANRSAKGLKKNWTWWVTVSSVMLVGLFALGVAGKSLYGSVSVREAKRHFDKGTVLEDSSNFSQAESEYRQAIRWERSNPKYYVSLADVLSTLNKAEEAQSVFGEAERLAAQALRENPTDQASRYYLGFALRGLSRFAEAEAELREAVRLNPSSADYHHILGVTLYSQREFAEAETELKAAIRLGPNRYLYHSSLATLFHRIDNYPKLEAELKETLRLNSQSTRAHRVMAIVLARQGKYAEAEKECKEAIRLYPSTSWGHRTLGDILTAQRKFSEAESEYREAVRGAPKEFEHRTALGDFLSAQKRAPEAEAEYKAAELGYQEESRLKPNDPIYLVRLGNFLKGRKRAAEAERAFREAIRIEPKEPDYHDRLGSSLEAQEKFSEAEASYREAIRLNPVVTFYRNNLAQVLATQKKFTEAEAEYNEAIRVYPNEAKFRASFAHYLVDRERYAESISFYRQALVLDPNHTSYHNNLGRALSRQKEYGEAESEFKKAKGIDPFEQLYRNNLILVLEDQKKFDEAEAEYKELTILYPHEPDFRDRYADFLLARKRYAEAVTVYGQAIKLDPNNAIYQNGLGVAFDRLKQYPAAEDQFKKASRLDPQRALYQKNLGIVLRKQNKYPAASNADAEAKRLGKN